MGIDFMAKLFRRDHFMAAFYSLHMITFVLMEKSYTRMSQVNPYNFGSDCAILIKWPYSTGKVPEKSVKFCVGT